MISSDAKHLESLPSSDIGSKGDFTGFRILLMLETGLLKSLLLQGVPEGRLCFESGETILDTELFLEAKDQTWYIGCNSPLQMINQDGEVGQSFAVADQCIYMVEGLGLKCVLLAEAYNRQTAMYRNYYVKKHTDINIGRGMDNDIVCSNKYIGNDHAVISYNEKGWSVYDRNSLNGVYVNGVKTKQAALVSGDIVDIMNVRIVIGVGFLSISGDDAKVKIATGKLLDVSTVTIEANERDISTESISEEPFNRQPRRRHALNEKEIVIKAPPLSMNSDGIPLLLRMGGSMVMSSTAMLSGHFTTMLSSVLFPVLTQKYTDKQRKEYEARRKETYTDYLRMKAAEIEEEIRTEESILRANYPELQYVLSYAFTKSQLWERRKTDDDFLSIRLGHGRTPLLAKCSFPIRDFEIEKDPLMEEMYKLTEKKYELDNAPVLLPLINDRVVGIVGSHHAIVSYIKGIIMQITLLHSYDEVKLVILARHKDLDVMEFVRYVPHVWNDQKSFRFIAENSEGAYQVGEYLRNEFESDLQSPRELKQIMKERPYYVVVALDRKLFDSIGIFKEALLTEKNCGISVIAAFDDLPKECSRIIGLSESGEATVLDVQQIDQIDETFYADTYEKTDAINAMRIISNIDLKAVTAAYSLPKSVSFLEMFGVGRVEHLNSLKRWHENNPVKSMATPVGIDTSGTQLVLDLHEKVHGPHGLIAGMTGSGKSEFVITYILSMAVNYHPDEVAFILIDYKGGGLAGAFDDPKKGLHLPHLVGTITNLDGSAIQRSLMSIQSELTRRQIIFNEAKSNSIESTMDIYTYQRMYREKRVKEPLPHLFIISDEFAELKKQQPEFMDQLISTARIGRSLGVHLILATQKPAGVVDDQIWSNTKFRVCLKVQDRGDSIGMLKRPEAAELKETGRFYLQVGYNELFELGQSAWCGADYEPQDTVAVQRDDEIAMLDTVGRTFLKTSPERKKANSDAKQLMAVVKYLCSLAERENIRPRSMWKDELGKQISLQEITEQYAVDEKRKGVKALLGLVDDPSHQDQYPLIMDMVHSRNLMIVGESGSGKTTMLQTMLYDLATHYVASEINFYILDFSSRNLGLFRKLPHCGAFLTSENEDDLERTFSLIREIINERREKFSEADVSNYEAYCEIESLPLILLLIDNLSAFEEFENHTDLNTALAELMKSGVGYGVKTIFTISQVNDCPVRVRREAGNKIALRARDRYAYSDILDCRCRYEPVDTPGRGICVQNENCYEYQTALAVKAENEKARADIIRQELLKLSHEMDQRYPVKTLAKPENNMEYNDFCNLFAKDRIPLGFSSMSIEKVSMPLQQLYSVSIYFGSTKSAATILENLIYAMHRENAQIIIVPRKGRSMFEPSSRLYEQVLRIGNVSTIDCSADKANALKEELKAVVLERKVLRKSYCDEHGITNWAEPESIQQWRKHVRANTYPVMVLFESWMELALSMDIESAAELSGFFQGMLGFNTYFWACHYSDDSENLRAAIGTDENDSDNEEQKTRQKEIRNILEGMNNSFNPDQFCLLFGGNYEKQNLIKYVPRSATDKKKSADKAGEPLLMQYHDSVYELVMPCGPYNETVQDIDEQDII